VATTDDDLLAARFEEDRQHLRGVAYRLLGSAEDADDAVQAAWLKVSRAESHDVANLTGWFTTVTARACLDQLRARKRRSEVSLPTDDSGMSGTAPSADEDVLLADSVGRAMTVVLNNLSPAQRVAFVLHDLFLVPFEEIGELLDRSPVAAKKLASRARGRVHGHGPGEHPPEAEHIRIVEAFLDASRGGDIPALLELLAPNVVRTVDRNLVPDHVPTEVRGARAVAEETRTYAARARTGVVALVDGAPGIVLAPRGRLQAVLLVRIHAGRIHAVDVVGDRQRLDALTIALPAPRTSPRPTPAGRREPPRTAAG
jgi:RNA polymerase sigma factor (sigma-70 family)